MTLCDFCDLPAVAVSTDGEADTRRARCAQHRVLGGVYGMTSGPGKPENAWLREPALDLDTEVMARIRRGNS